MTGKRKRGSKLHMAADTLGHLLALHVTPASADDRAEVGRLAKAVQVATGGNVELAYVGQGYTGDKPAALQRLWAHHAATTMDSRIVRGVPAKVTGRWHLTVAAEEEKVASALHAATEREAAAAQAETIYKAATKGFGPEIKRLRRIRDWAQSHYHLFAARGIETDQSPARSCAGWARRRDQRTG